MNSEIIDFMRDLDDRLDQTDTQDTPPADVAANVTRTAAQAITSATPTNVSWDTQVEDTEEFWVAGTPTRLTIPMDGRYGGYAFIEWASNATGIREVNIYLNGATILAGLTIAPVSGRSVRMSVPFEKELVSGDYLEVNVEQTSGGNLNVTGRAAIHLCP